MKARTRSVVSGPPSAGSISDASWKALTVSSHTSSTTASRMPAAIVEGSCAGTSGGVR